MSSTIPNYFYEEYYLKAKVAYSNNVDEPGPSKGKWTVADLEAVLAGYNMSAFDHYKAYGRGEGVAPNPYFNEYEYLRNKLQQLQSTEPEEGWTLEKLEATFRSLGLSAADHYERYGFYEQDASGRYLNPSNAFDATAYYEAKALICQKSGETVNGKTGTAITAADVCAAFAVVSATPVYHYLAWGAGEADRSGIPLVQSVPMAYRVDNDPGREPNTGDILPANYNIENGVTDPSDVSGVANVDMSPVVLVGTASPLNPGQTGYNAPPDNVVDTALNPLISMTVTEGDSTVQYWLAVDRPHYRALMLDQNGCIKGWLPVSMGHGSGASVVRVVIPGDFYYLQSVDRKDVPSSVTILEDQNNNFIGSGEDPQPTDTSGITARAEAREIPPDYAQTLFVEGSVHSSGASSVTLNEEGKIGAWSGQKIGATLPDKGFGNYGGEVLDASAVTGAGQLTLTTDAFTFPLTIIGSDTVATHIAAPVHAVSISAGNGNNVITVGAGAIVESWAGNETGIALGNGNNTVIVNNGGRVASTGEAAISLGNGMNTLTINGTVTADAQGQDNVAAIRLGSGKDVVQVSGTVEVKDAGNDCAAIDLGQGSDNTLTVTGGSITATGGHAILGGDNGNTITISSGTVTGDIKTGDLQDVITISGGTVTGNMYTGGARDIIILYTDATYVGTIDGGAGGVDAGNLLAIQGSGFLDLPVLVSIETLDLALWGSKLVQHVTVRHLTGLPDTIEAIGSTGDTITFAGLTANSKGVGVDDPFEWELDGSTLTYVDDDGDSHVVSLIGTGQLEAGTGTADIFWQFA